MEDRVEHERREFLKGGTAIAATAAAGVLLRAPAALAQQAKVKVGVMLPYTGTFAALGVAITNGFRLAIEERGGKPGGREIEYFTVDDESSPAKAPENANRLVQRDKVDVVFAGFSSASREAYRPIVNQFDGLAFYNNQYEGGVCDANMIVTGAVPEQQFSTLIPWMMETYGKNVYTLAADYNFGQISAEWVRNIVAENGGTMAGEEFIPLGVSQFSQTIQNIQGAKPDFVVTLLVGAAQASYYEQAASAGVGLPMASSVNVGQGYEHKRFTPPSLKDMYVTTNYIEEIDTPASKAFIAKFKAKYPDEPYINQEAANSYIAMNLYKLMVERAGSTDREALRAEIAKGDVCFDGPSGNVCLDPKSQHMSHTIFLAKVEADHSITFPKVWENIAPYWLGEAGCDLTKNDPSEQYTPSNPPK